MGQKMLEVLSPEWTQRQTSIAREGLNSGDWSSKFRAGMHLCELEYVQHSQPAVIRETCRELVDRFRPALRSMDFSEAPCRIERTRPSSAKQLADQFGGRWWQMSEQLAGVEFLCAKQPQREVMPLLWMMAAVSGERDLAREVATAYKLHPPAQISAGSEMREAILRYALAEDREAEETLAAKLQPGYSSDFPPMLIEFPLGVIRGDSEMLLKAVSQAGTKLKAKWDVKKWRAKHDELVAKGAARGRPHEKTWELEFDWCRQLMVSRHWIFSWWGLAWLNIARWRGMDVVFQSPKAFSEWAPLSLCQWD